MLRSLLWRRYKQIVYGTQEKLLMNLPAVCKNGFQVSFKAEFAVLKEEKPN